MPLYQLTLFYPKLKEHAGAVQSIRADVESFSGKNWRLLSAGEQVCAIVFETDVEHKQLQTRFDTHGSEHFLLFLTEIHSIVSLYLTKDVSKWLSSHLPRNK